MLFAAFTLAFHGFLRVSKFTIPPHTQFNPRLHHSTSPLYLPHSKTDQLCRGGSPVTICHAPTSRQDGQRKALCSHSAMPLTRHLCLHYLRSSLRLMGCNQEDFNIHSFRIGAATTTAHKGASEATIQHLSRWRSNAVKTYIHPSLSFRTLDTHTILAITVTHHSAPLSHYQTLCDQVLNQFGR